eukprot:UN22607
MPKPKLRSSPLTKTPDNITNSIRNNPNNSVHSRVKSEIPNNKRKKDHRKYPPGLDVIVKRRKTEKSLW